MKWRAILPALVALVALVAIAVYVVTRGTGSAPAYGDTADTPPSVSGTPLRSPHPSASPRPASGSPSASRAPSGPAPSGANDAPRVPASKRTTHRPAPAHTSARPTSTPPRSTDPVPMWQCPNGPIVPTPADCPPQTPTTGPIL